MSQQARQKEKRGKQHVTFIHIQNYTKQKYRYTNQTKKLQAAFPIEEKWRVSLNVRVLFGYENLKHRVLYNVRWTKIQILVLLRVNLMVVYSDSRNPDHSGWNLIIVAANLILWQTQFTGLVYYAGMITPFTYAFYCLSLCSLH